MKSRAWRWLPALLALALGAQGAELQVSVRETVGGEPLLLDSLRYENAAHETFSVTRLSYLLSGFALQREEGGAWQELPGQTAWLDAERRRDTLRLTGIQAGRYRALRFAVGLDRATDATDPAQYPPAHPLNANLNGLHWGWQGGYIFLALEGRFRAGPGEPGGYACHLARAPQRTVINLPVALDLTQDAGLALELDVATLLNAPRPLSFIRDGSATHSRAGDPVAAALTANLQAAFRVRSAAPAQAAAPAPAPMRPLWLPPVFTPYRFTLNRAFPIPDLPRDNPLLEERVALGRALFHEPALSRDRSLSCASCHQPGAGLGDARRVSLGTEARAGARNAMPLYNLAWKESFFWDGRAASLREQALLPIQEHREMDETLPRVVEKLRARPEYAAQFQAAYGAPEITAEKIGLALEQFLLTLTAGDSRFDRALRGQAVLTEPEQRGFALFMTEYDPRTGQRGADCFHCHGGPLFTDHQFHNNGLVSTEPDLGRAAVTGRDADRHKFSTPGLRNVALTAPYMHDGRFATLEEVVDHYASPLPASPTLDPNLAKHPAAGLPLTGEEKAALVAFLRTLTDESLRTP